MTYYIAFGWLIVVVIGVLYALIRWCDRYVMYGILGTVALVALGFSVGAALRVVLGA